MPGHVVDSGKKRFFKAVGIVLFLIAVAVVVGWNDARKEKVRADFSTFSLAASRVMFAGGDPYDKLQVMHNYKYFPVNAILLYPFSLVSVYAAQGMWFALNLGLLMWAISSLRQMLRPVRIPWWVYLVVALIMFRFVVMNFRLGQWNMSVFCLSIIGLRYILDNRWWGGVLLGLAVTLKFMPAIFFIYLATQRRWKDFSITLASVLFWVLMFPAIVLGPARTDELLRQYYTDSVERVNKMTSGHEVSSVSMHSTIYRAITPATLELKGIVYRANVLDLSYNQAASIAKIISAIFLGWFILWLMRQGKKREQINELGALLIIGLCYMAWFLAAPGVRHAQLVSTMPISLALVVAMHLVNNTTARRVLGTGIVMSVLLYSAPAEFKDKSRYNLMLEANGVLAWAMTVEFVMGIYAFYKVGIGPLPRRQWEVDEQGRSTLETLRYS